MAQAYSLCLLINVYYPIYLFSEIFPGVSRGPICSSCTRAHSPVWPPLRRVRVQIAVATLSGNSLRQTVHTHRASVHQAAKLVPARVTAGLAESNGSLPPGL